MPKTVIYVGEWVLCLVILCNAWNSWVCNTRSTRTYRITSCTRCLWASLILLYKLETRRLVGIHKRVIYGDTLYLSVWSNWWFVLGVIGGESVFLLYCNRESCTHRLWYTVPPRRLLYSICAFINPKTEPSFNVTLSIQRQHCSMQYNITVSTARLYNEYLCCSHCIWHKMNFFRLSLLNPAPHPPFVTARIVVTIGSDDIKHHTELVQTTHNCMYKVTWTKWQKRWKRHNAMGGTTTYYIVLIETSIWNNCKAQWYYSQPNGNCNVSLTDVDAVEPLPMSTYPMSCSSSTTLPHNQWWIWICNEPILVSIHPSMSSI